MERSEASGPLEHGGDLQAAERRFGTPAEGWIDLSTGINPDAYPAGAPSAAAWQRLPGSDDGLAELAARAYGAPAALPVPGSQAAINTLPALRPPGRVAVPAAEYGEHAPAWARWGHTVERIDAATVAAGPPARPGWEVLVLSHPNNPTGRRYPKDVLRAWHQALAARGGWLVLDEAFADATPERSLAGECGPAGLLVLRSLGKFYGLAGARVGFLLGDADARRRLAELLGPWPLAGPAREAAYRALADTAWRRSRRRSLSAAAGRLRALLAAGGLDPAGGTPLFQWVPSAEPRARQAALARAGIWVRAFDAPAGLRLGLPGSEAAWERLARALGQPGPA